MHLQSCCLAFVTLCLHNTSRTQFLLEKSKSKPRENVKVRVFKERVSSHTPLEKNSWSFLASILDYVGVGWAGILHPFLLTGKYAGMHRQSSGLVWQWSNGAPLCVAHNCDDYLFLLSGTLILDKVDSVRYQLVYPQTKCNSQTLFDCINRRHRTKNLLLPIF